MIMTDTRLCERGRTHAIEVHQQFLSNPTLLEEFQQLEVVLSSPLSRTLETAHYVFGHTTSLLPKNVSKVVVPVLRERLYMTSDVGRPKSELVQDSLTHGWDLSQLPEGDQAWWYVRDDERHPPYQEWRIGKYYCDGEPEILFYERMKELRHYLLSRPEKRILVIAHWGVFHALTGKDFRNCQLEKVTSTELEEWDLEIFYPEVKEVEKKDETGEEGNGKEDNNPKVELTPTTN